MPEERSTCRDFERGVCSRGDKCKYYHPDSATPAEGAKLPICKDYQNKGCSRFKCKFLHITVDEEAEYNTTGKLPEHGGNPEKVSRPAASASGSGNKDVCRDFLNGKCDRGPRCKFSHQSERESFQNGAYPGSSYGKRPRGDDMYGAAYPVNSGLADENELLKRKVDDLHKEIINLRQINDTLYDQNAKYRSQLSSSVVYPQVTQQSAAAAMYAHTSAALPTSTMKGPYSYLTQY